MMAEEEEEAAKVQNGAAKTQSRWAMLFSTVWIAVLTVLHGLGVISLEVTDIIYSAIAIVGVWSPAYMSIWLDKIKEIRFGDESRRQR